MKKVLLMLLCLIFFLAIYITYIEPYWIDTRKIDFYDQDIPEVFNDLKIVFVSDIHHGPFFFKKRLHKLVVRINRLKPDLILLGGDYVHLDPKYIKSCFQELKKLEARLGEYGVLGNHDHWESAEITRTEMRMAGIKLLDNEGVWIKQEDSRIKVGGVADFLQDQPDLNPIINDVNQKDFLILVTHNPDFLEEVNSDKLDLVCAGHTHGGQVTLFGLWAPLLPSKYGQKYRSGLIDLSYTKVIVSNGIGTITPPVRFWARPQINLITLKTNK